MRMTPVRKAPRMICSPIFAARATNPTKSATAIRTRISAVVSWSRVRKASSRRLRSARLRVTPIAAAATPKIPNVMALLAVPAPGCREEQRQQRDCPELAEGRARDRQLAKECPGLEGVGENRHDESQGAGRQCDGEEQRAADPPGGVEREPGG